jgi:hypothetical protein
MKVRMKTLHMWMKNVQKERKEGGIGRGTNNLLFLICQPTYLSRYLPTYLSTYLPTYLTQLLLQQRFTSSQAKIYHLSKILI